MRTIFKWLGYVFLSVALGGIFTTAVQAEPVHPNDVKTWASLQRYLYSPTFPGDASFKGANGYDMAWDASLYTLFLEDNVILGFGNTSAAPDIYMRWDATNFDILSSTAGYDLTIGTASAAIDLIWQGDTAGSTVKFNEEDLRIELAGKLMIQFTEQAAPSGDPGGVLGWLYCKDDGSHSALYWEDEAGTVTNLTGAAAGTLDAAYSAGSPIAVDTLAIVMTVSDGDNNAVLVLTQEDVTTDPNALEINLSSTSTGTAIDIDGQSTAYDIKGTGDLFTVSGAGALVAASGNFGTGAIIGGTLDVSAAGGITLENDETITNTTDSEISLLDSVSGRGVILDLDASATAIGLKAGGAVAGIQFGTVDELTGVGSIVFDAAASNDITVAATGAGHDITISQTGTQNASVHVLSAGTGADAITAVTTAGGIDITVAGAGDTENLDLTCNEKINITSSEDADVAIHIQTSNVAGQIQITSADTTDDGIEIDSAGGIDMVAAAGAVVVTATGGATGDMTLTVGDEYILNVEGGLQMDSNEAAADAIELLAPLGGIDLTSTGAGLDIDLLATGGRVTITTTETAPNQFHVDAQGADTGDAIILETTNSGILLLADGAADGDIALDAQGLISLTTEETAANQVLVNATGAIAGNAIVLQTTRGGISIDANHTDDGDFTLAADSVISMTATGGSAEDFGITCTSGSVNISGGEADAAAVTVAAAAGGIDITSGGASYDVDITATGGTVNIIGNENAASAIKLATTGAGGSAETILIHNDQGTSTANTASAIQVTSTLGSIELWSGLNAADAIALEVDGNTASGIVLYNDTGTGAASISLLSDAGGITLAVPTTKAITLTTADAGNMDASPTTDGRRLAQVLRATYDHGVSGGSQGTISLGQTLPDNAIVTRAYYEVIDIFTSGGGDAASISIDIVTNDVAGIVAATLISAGGDIWDPGYHECIQDGTAAAFSVKTTDARLIQITIAGGQDVTAGKFVLWLEYVVSD